MTSPTFNCRSCQSTDAIQVLDLGLQPLANNLLLPADLAKKEPRFPLELWLCQQCKMLQIRTDVPPVELFSEYLYFSSFSDAMLKHARQASERYIKDFGLNSSSLVVEIASNDGYLLQNFVREEIPCLGIEPAANIAIEARKRGVETLTEFFNRTLARELSNTGRSADLILGNNVFAHVPSINDFVAGLKILLKPKGRIIFEFPYAVNLIEKNEFDTIYHEHVFYFSLTALMPVFQRHGLQIHHVEEIPIHGGSLRLFASHQGALPVEPSVAALLQSEQNRGMNTTSYYTDFAQRVHALKSSLKDLLHKLKIEGSSIAAYGAAAKGSTLINFFDLDAALIDFVADRSTYKHGRLMPGKHIPILPPGELFRRRPDYTLLLTWNFADEILRQQDAYRQNGGRFIIPIPKVAVV